MRTTGAIEGSMGGGATFDFRSNTIRVVQIDGEPWFVAKDVCESLGLKLHNGSTSHHLRTLNDDETTSMSKVEVRHPGTGMALARLVSESGLYKLIMRSDKPQARAFQDWVTRTVLPPLPLPPEPA